MNNKNIFHEHARYQNICSEEAETSFPRYLFLNKSNNSKFKDIIYAICLRIINYYY